MRASENPPEDRDPRIVKLHLVDEIVRSARWVLYLAVAYIPLQGFAHIAEVISGRRTDFTVHIGVTLGLTIYIGTGAVLYYKIRRQREELERLRDRQTRLERELAECRSNLRGGATR